MGQGKMPPHGVKIKQSPAGPKMPPHGHRGAPVTHKGGNSGTHGGSGNR